MQDNHGWMRARPTGIARQLSLIAVAIVVAALCALAVGPLVVLKEIQHLRDRTAATSERAQNLVTGLRLLLAEEMGAHEAYRLQHDPATVERYQQLRAREERSLAEMELLADVAGPRSAAQVDSFRALTVRAHRLTDSYVAGDIDDAHFIPQVTKLDATRDSANAVLTSLDSSLARSREASVEIRARVLARQRLFALATGAVALIGIAVVVTFARRDRALSEKLARALEEEARARGEADRRRRELEQVTESKTRLMRGFTHDVKNPIGAADGFMQLLQDGVTGQLVGAQASVVERARRCIAEALRLIDDLLNLARAEAGEIDVHKEPVDLTALARETMEEYRAQAGRKGLTLRIQTVDERVCAESDPARLRQVIGNLVSNAVKYTTHGGVTLRIAARRGLDGTAPRVTIEVADTGSGIPVGRQHLVFEEFVRLDPDAAPGAGVGLAISQRIARALGGEITMTSEPGRGSSFVLSLPAAERRLVAQELSQPAA